jgi:hypothetical protein
MFEMVIRKKLLGHQELNCRIGMRTGTAQSSQAQAVSLNPSDAPIRCCAVIKSGEQATGASLVRGKVHGFNLMGGVPVLCVTFPYL